jgi:hypothetical protein
MAAGRRTSRCVIENAAKPIKIRARAHYGVSMCDVRTLLSLPIRLNHDVVVCEGDMDGRHYGEVLDTVKVPHVSLGQFLHGILWELSFHGGPEEQKSFVRQMNSLREEMDHDAGQGFSAMDGFFEGDSRAGSATVLDLGGCAARDIAQALRNLEDDEVVETGLRRALGAEIAIKPEYAQMNARTFRGIFRAASH